MIAAGTEMPGTFSSMKRSARAERRIVIDGRSAARSVTPMPRGLGRERLEQLGSKQIWSCRNRAPASAFLSARSAR